MAELPATPELTRTERERVLARNIEGLARELQYVRGRLAEAEEIVFGLSDAWGGIAPPPASRTGFLWAVWVDASAYHDKYRPGGDTQ